ncbi:efflux RND transporter permease subunit [Candidatus Thiodictyon syntrophicum]|jgi:multidrug efflux pump subunit AcrB|uniref:ACR family transporter n=1 Tax=Candidatus Thiodictyon syntrophicum TaxID=1166950 RepID=A0A2K8UAU3_9GAMM|nr:efflux RND transporter permease subunit [Candidatus Thiodictyon syntrophicum]AUB82657.1 ACR family transporter [Candidatus Thiodictyon syntrophicum]
MSGFNLSGWAISNRSLMVFVMIVAVAAGVGAFFSLGRAEDPAFTFRTMVVRAAWPGATLEDTLDQVTERLERTLQEVPNLDHLRSFTNAGTTTIFVDLKGSTSPSEVPDTWYQVRKKVADMRHTLPPGIIGPGFNDEFGDTFGIIYGFTADGFSHRELRDYVEDVRSQLLRVQDVAKVDVLGAQDERIFVEFDMAKLAGMGFDPAALTAALQAQNVVRPTGVIQTGDEAMSLRVSGAFRSEADLLAVNFAIGERMLRLGDIASVRRGYADPPQPMFRVDGQPALGLAVVMREGGDILALGANIAKAMRGIVANLPIGIEVTRVADQPVTVDEAINDFTTSLWQAIGIILAVSFLSLGVRAGTVVALSIPLTLALVFAIMGLVHIDLHRISLGALIIALALLVDDAMTTVDAMTRRLALGEDKFTAATFAYRTLAFAMLTGTLVTIAGFIPIGFAQSTAGEYTFSIFAVVAIALVVSWLVAVVFAPLLGMALLVPPKGGAEPQRPGPVMRGYRAFLNGAMRVRWLTILVTIALFAVSIYGMRLVPRQFFPSSDRPDLLVNLTLPQNASIHASQRAAERLDAILGKDADVDHWSTYVGQGAVRFYLPLDVQLAQPFFAQVVIVAKDVAARERLQTKLETVLKEEFPAAVGRVAPLELGPPVGWPVQYRVIGPDPVQLREIALQLAGIVAAEPATRDVNFDWMEPARQLYIRIDQDQARRVGLSSQAIAAVLNTNISGTTVTQVRDDIFLIDVVMREQEGQRLSFASLQTLPVALPDGRSIPLNQIASFDFGQDFPLIWRRDRVPTLTVQADVSQGVLPDTVVEALAPKIADLTAGLPVGYTIELGGTVEESAQSQASVMAVVPLMILIMLTVLMFQLRSFPLLIMVISVVPLGLIGVVAALLLANKPLGFVAILGVLALVGMIAKNSVILITQIEQDRAAGMPIWDAVVEASSSRFRPIMLTAMSTVLGLIPIAPTVFWGPMAFAIMGGLLVGSLLTLIFVPTLYVTWESLRGADLRARPGAEPHAHPTLATDGPR